MDYNIINTDCQAQSNGYTDYWDAYAIKHNIDPRDLHVVPAKRYGNGRTITYPDGSQIVQIADKPIFRRASAPPAADTEDIDDDPIISRTEDPAQRAVRRARNKIRDMCYCTSFEWFVTLTLDSRKIDRYNWSDVLHAMTTWLDHRVRRYGLAYIIVPEHHKDGAYHLHGLINSALNKQMIPSGITDRRTGHSVYNLGAWQYGYTSCARITGTYHAAIGYVCKYISKEGQRIGGRWYYSGGNLYDLGTPTVDVYHIQRDPIDLVLDNEYSRSCDLDDLGARYAIAEYNPPDMPQTPTARASAPIPEPPTPVYPDLDDCIAQMSLFPPSYIRPD